MISKKYLPRGLRSRGNQRPLEVKIKLCKNRIKKLESDIDKKKVEIEIAKNYLNSFLKYLD